MKVSPTLKSQLRAIARWVVLGATLFFLAHTLRQHWADVVQLRLRPSGDRWLLLSLAVTAIAHTWSGWVWGWLLREFDLKVNLGWATRVFLQTNIAKYLPGNIWHFYGRIRAATAADLPGVSVTASVLLEPLLMAAAALPVVMLSLPDGGVVAAIALLVVLLGVHPRLLNPVLDRVARSKLGAPKDGSARQSYRIQHYPLRPLLGELGFVALRSGGFLLAWLAIAPISLATLPILVGGFSLAWLLGLVVPGAPGGVGVLEATAVAVLDETFPVEVVLGAVALYRLISVLAEAGGAGVALWLARREKQS